MTALHPSVTKCHLAGSADCRLWAVGFGFLVAFAGWCCWGLMLSGSVSSLGVRLLVFRFRPVLLPV